MQCTVIGKFFEAVGSLLEDEKTPKEYGAGHLLYHSEINFLDAVYRNPNVNAIGLAKILNVTRGAITQMGNKLEEKGFIERFLKEGNKKEKYYRLTPLGETIRKGHAAYHHCANKQICAYIQSLTVDETKVIMAFLDRMMQLPVSEFECDNACLNTV